MSPRKADRSDAPSRGKGISAQNSVEPTAEQLVEIERQYGSALMRNETLLDEVTFILSERLNSSGIKIHAVEKRVKTLSSVLGKCRSKGIRNFSELKDIVGSRVVCLFRSDMARVGQLIAQNFDMVEVDAKLANVDNPLGYISSHYSCKMPKRYQGPRYENTSDTVFEIQVRTLCMHAWAAVSHYLDYKGDWDVPSDLKRALSALSGLFYVADNEFEQFYAARVDSQKRADKAIDPNKVEEINLDTLTTYLATQFRDREIDPEVTSELVQMIKEAGYTSLSQVSSDIAQILPTFEKYEKGDPPRGGRYSAFGAARICLAMVSKEFFESHRKRGGADDFYPPVV
jgi:putative GTP pyrophosphokinase